MDTTALVVHAAGDLRLDRRAPPDPAPAEAVVRVRYGGICGSDLHYWQHGRVGESVLRSPMVLGHEIVGTVEVAAADGTGPTVGTPVYVHPAIVCGMCVMCRSGRRHLCERLRYLGSAARVPHTDGGFAGRMVVDVERLRSIEGIDATASALIEPATIAAHAVGRVAAVGGSVRGATVGVIGCGPIGLLVVAALRRAGAGRVVATDLFPGALGRAARLGADRVALAADAEAVLREEAPDVVLESSGSAPGLASALRTARVGGMVVLVGQLAPDPVAPMHLVVGRELVVTGSSRAFDEADDVITGLRDGALAVDGVVTHVVPVAGYAEAFATAADASVSGKVLLDFADA